MTIERIEAMMETIKDIEQAKDSTATVWAHFTTGTPYFLASLVTVTGLPYDVVSAACIGLMADKLIRPVGPNKFQLTPMAFLAVHPPK